MRDELIKIWPKGGLSTILDLGCRDCWHTAGLPGVTRHVGVEIWPLALDLAMAKHHKGGIPGFEGILADAATYLETAPGGVFEGVVAIDMIEHLEQWVALEFLTDMVRVATRLAVVWTTLGFIETPPADVDGRFNPFEIHVWGPSREAFEANGWQVKVYPDWHGSRGGAILAWVEK